MAANAKQSTRTNNLEFQVDETGSDFEHGSRGEVNGAAVAGACCGGLLGGPIGAVVLAAGAAYLAAKKEGDAGDWARKSGSTLNEVGKKVVTFEKENNILDKTTKGLIKGAGWVEKQFSSTKTKPSLETEANLTS